MAVSPLYSTGLFFTASRTYHVFIRLSRSRLILSELPSDRIIIVSVPGEEFEVSTARKNIKNKTGYLIISFF